MARLNQLARQILVTWNPAKRDGEPALLDDLGCQECPESSSVTAHRPQLTRFKPGSFGLSESQRSLLDGLCERFVTAPETSCNRRWGEVARQNFGTRSSLSTQPFLVDALQVACGLTENPR